MTIEDRFAQLEASLAQGQMDESADAMRTELIANIKAQLRGRG